MDGDGEELDFDRVIGDYDWLDTLAYENAMTEDDFDDEDLIYEGID
jgi:hypothetical protein